MEECGAPASLSQHLPPVVLAQLVGIQYERTAEILFAEGRDTPHR